MSPFVSRVGCATALALLLSTPVFAQNQTAKPASDEDIVLDVLVIKAASEELKQALGVSNISAEDIERRPSGRDVSEIIRQMPGVNLTGNTSTGQRGNNRQIDIRGMGPENTLILIDGKPVLSRNSVRMGRAGERDTRGDSNWVPPEDIERIEVIRGPAAARYGSGAAGGVVNIITKRPENTTFTVSTYMKVPEHNDEGGTRRVTASIGGPINDIFSYRLSAGASWTDPDALTLNNAAAGKADAPAGREGVVTYDVKGLWSAQINADHRLDLEASYSRQGNKYAGDTLLSSPDNFSKGLFGSETNTLERTALSLTHFGTYDFGQSNSFIQWEHTDNNRLGEGRNGRTEGRPNTNETTRILLDNITAKSELDLPLVFLRDQTVTLGAEYRGEFMDESGDKSDAHLVGLYVEDNILINDQFTLTPGLRFDAHSSFGANLSPSLNASFAVNDEWTIKGGIARAFKAPNLFQLNPNFLYQSAGNGCPIIYPGSCRVLGNPDLAPEVSLNKEIGVSYANVDGWMGSLTYFHNDYENRIASGNVRVATVPENTFRWENSGPAVISGLEGNVTVPLLETLSWTTNFTKIIETEDKTTGQPLSLVPEYTINTALRWEAMENLGLTLSATHYGKINPRTMNIRGQEVKAEPREAYTLVNFSLDYAMNDNVKLAAGVDNVFDERLFRTDSSNGANTFNEPGRAYYVSLTGKF